MIPATHDAPRTVASLMTRDPLTLSPDERLDIARTMMISSRVRHLPVVQAERLLGILSVRDIAGIPLPRETPASAVMRSPVYSVESAAPIDNAIETLFIHRFSCLPVVDNGRLVGIVTTTDLVRLACARLGDEPVSRLMTPGPLHTIAPDQTLSVAHLLMKSERIRHLSVVDGGRLVGFLSDLDLLAGESHQTVAEAMPRHIVAVSPEGRAAEAGHLLILKRLDAVPAIRSGKLVGILSAFDYLSYLLSQEPE